MLLLLSLLGASHGLVHNRTADLLHAHLQTTLDAGLAAFHERQLPSDFEETNSTPIVKDVVNIMFGGIFFLLAVSVHWFNEERSAKTEVLLTRGLEDCKSVDANHACAENRGCLIHVQGRAAGKLPIADAQFQDAVVHDCLKLQCTLEVLQWVPATGMVKDTPGQRHVTEWTTSHFDSSRFRQPSPQNPRLPAGLHLGTRTTPCSRVELGAFSLSEDMLTHFHSYREALQQLPKVVHAGGVAFHANPQDGFFYGRPGCPGANLKAQLPYLDGVQELEESKVGDLRARFLCTPNCDATVVAVQIHKESENRETFLPYRVVPIPPCNGEEQARLKIVEAGEKSLRDLRREACCTGGVVTCCCCPCNTVACCTSQEVLTEEIFFISDSKEPKEKPFRKAVARNPWRLWNWRLLGWAFLYISLQWLLPPVLGRISRLYAMGGLSQALCLVIFTLAVWAVVVSAAYACYRHSMAIKYFLAAMILTGLPFVFNIH